MPKFETITTLDGTVVTLNVKEIASIEHGIGEFIICTTVPGLFYRYRPEPDKASQEKWEDVYRGFTKFKKKGKRKKNKKK